MFYREKSYWALFTFKHKENTELNDNSRPQVDKGSVFRS